MVLPVTFTVDPAVTDTPMIRRMRPTLRVIRLCCSSAPRVIEPEPPVFQFVATCTGRCQSRMLLEATV